MINLLEGLCWLVIEGAPTPEAVAAALPWPTTREADGPRRLALAPSIHEVSDEAFNLDRLALFTHGGFAFLSKPGGLTVACDDAIERALSARFGVVWRLASFGYAPAVVCFAHGAEMGRVDMLGVRPAGGLLGLAEALGDGGERAVIPGAFERLVGAPWAEVFPREGATATFWRRTL